MSGTAIAPASAIAPEAIGSSGGPVFARRRLPLAAKLAIALVGLVTLVLLINGGINLWLNDGEAKRAVVGVQQEKAQAAAERVDAFISDLESQIGWTTRAEWRRVSSTSSATISSAFCGKPPPSRRCRTSTRLSRRDDRRRLRPRRDGGQDRG